MSKVWLASSSSPYCTITPPNSQEAPAATAVTATSASAPAGPSGPVLSVQLQSPLETTAKPKNQGFNVRTAHLSLIAYQVVMCSLNALIRSTRLGGFGSYTSSPTSAPAK